MVPVSPSLFDQVSTLIWTHERPATVMQSRFNTRRNFYMIRDGRDAITSMIHYSVKERSRKLRPQYKIETASKVYSNINLFTKWTIEWAAHVDSYIENESQFYGVHYEELVANPEKTIHQIIDHLFRPETKDFAEIQGEIRAAVETTDRDKFRARAPDHMHKGQPGSWKEEWTEEHCRIFLHHAGNEMSRLGYV
jgi:hypothetical protein